MGQAADNPNDVDLVEQPDAGKDAVADPGQTPFAVGAQQHWTKAREHVQRTVALSQAFNTLRDMNGSDFIRPEQLSTIKLLGQGAFATVEKSM